ncbi:MAG TPA: DUF1648 domain-containing protein [Candidatus Aquilonibacter sp.]|jgi:hypothetical protein|nr:DUF1648 domain-containing protein [Candidatus Aquilonibacter sp.]
MSRTWYKILTALLWLAPTAIGLRYWQVWDRLSLRVASHFDAAGHANGWMTRNVSLYYTVGFMGCLAAVFTVVLYVVQKKYALAKLSWALLVFLNVEIWTVAYAMNSILDFNLSGTPITIAPLPIVTGVGTLMIVIVALGEKRGTALASTEVLAEEVHSGKAWGAIFIAPLVVLGAISLLIPNAVARLTVGVVGVIMIAAFAMAWDGFHYYFTRHGVEIRTLGFRLKSIPLLQIKNYEIQSWSPIRGYGIRGVGNHKAYVWGKSGVRVEMYDGEVFLGHNDPQRIVHDLNVIKQYQRS